jgi:hypothetical protein
MFCTYCGCHVDLHDDELGCVCEASQGHRLTLEITDGNEYCDCERTHSEFARYSGWSSDEAFVGMNRIKGH